MNRELTEEQTVFLEGIAQTYGDMLYRYCAKCVSYNPKLMPLVPDLVQEVYLKASIHVSVLMYHNNIPGWLKKSCHFSLLNMLRNRKSGREILFPTAEKLQQMLNNNQSAVHPSDNTFTLEEVMAAAQTILSEEDQAIFNDYFLDDFSTQETAELNQMTCDAVRGRISRIRKKLKKHFNMTEE